ncbi:MAG: transposase [Mycoplasmataceae bacterium CE_OT135]|nr:MAG: transposase [Mycoplasmataceae bacterium CE_OT135]KLL03361.1 MAG: transposase [Mycoplasmataceae bacterium CE_OT135]
MEKNLTINNKINLTINPQHLHQLHNQGYAWNKIATFYEVSERTVYRWIKPNNQPKQTVGRKPKITKDIFARLQTYIIQNSTVTQQDMINFFTQQTGLTIHQSNISRLLKRKGITYKKLTYHYTLLNKEKARVFAEETKSLLAKHPFMAIDECSFYPNEDPRYGYSLKGSRAISKRPRSKGDNHYTLLLCIKNANQGGIFHHKLIERGANTKIFHDFLEEIDLYVDKKHYLLLDNASIHRAPDKRKELNLPSIEAQLAMKNIEARFIISYAPMLNPVELCFNFLRQQTEKKRPRNLEELKEAIEKVIEMLNKKDLNKYFEHCMDYFEDKNQYYEH